ncbi:hypothetical protein [Nocardia sp. alder85J]|uniref:hypothetical protein n=1 Tax=Nocardia sp. alder85J TaxID=2862949 RepID=UPI001CD54322|nr:hypothetical protein [Nocardia sp. alder85J]MCX4091025.1 hypothetical protein [Nocardia sp. alder85J]
MRSGGPVVLVGLGTPEVTFTTNDLVARRATLAGSTPLGNPADVEAVLNMIATGEPTIAVRTIGFDDIPGGLAELAAGRVSGRRLAVSPAA